MPAGLHLRMSGLVVSFVRSSLQGGRLEPDTTGRYCSVRLQADL